MRTNHQSQSYCKLYDLLDERLSPCYYPYFSRDWNRHSRRIKTICYYSIVTEISSTFLLYVALLNTDTIIVILMAAYLIAMRAAIFIMLNKNS